ncbi:MAG: YkgJ family cysteine cluster protein [Lachnospiraceae bacterium]
MIPPRKVAFEAKKRENENLEFRTYLKCNANEKELDQQFLKLHEELFETYDCSKCRNCCKQYYGSIPPEDLEKDAKQLGMTKEQFMDLFFGEKDTEENYKTKHKPCDFLQEDGNCMLGDCKPQNCKNYPYTNQPERLQSLYSVLDVVGICPVAFEIYERLKKEYRFKK